MRVHLYLSPEQIELYLKGSDVAAHYDNSVHKVHVSVDIRDIKEMTDIYMVIRGRRT